MAVSQVSIPESLISAYLPIVYKFTSSFSDLEGGFTNAFPGDDNKVILVVTGLGNLSRNIKPDGTITITNSGLYDGEHVVIQRESNGSLSIDTEFIGGDAGNVSYSRLNARMICNLFIDGSFVVQQTRFSNLDGEFEFEFGREVQIHLGNGLEPLSINSTVKGPRLSEESTATIYVEYTDVEDVIVGGVITSDIPSVGSIGTKTSDIVVVNSTVPYLEWASGGVFGEIKSISTDLSEFAIGAVSGTNRFLTNSPKNITIGSSDFYQLAIMIDYDANVNYRLMITRYNAAGSQIGFAKSTFTGLNSDSVWFSRVGPRIGSFLNGISSYDVVVIDLDNNDAELSETITFTIDDNCHQSKTRFVWLNPRGGYDAFNFYAPRSTSNNVVKDSFIKNRTYPVVIGSTEKPIINVSNNSVISVKTSKISTEEAEWLNELIESPEVFIELPESNPLHDKLIPVNILDGTFKGANSYDSTHVVSVRYSLGFEKIHLRAN